MPLRPSRLTWRLFLTVLLAGGAVLFLELRLPPTDANRTGGRKAFAVDARSITRIELIRGGLSLQADLREGVWMLSEPKGMRADASVIRRVLDRLEKVERGDLLTMDTLKAAGRTYSDYGLADPAVRLVLHSERSRRELLFGSNTPLGKEVYAMEAGGRNVMSVESDLLAILPPDPHDWRDRRVFPCEPGGFTRIELHRPSGFIELAVVPGQGWEIRQPFAARALRDGVVRLLQLLAGLRVEKFIADTIPAGGGYGFEEEKHVIRAWMEGSDYPLRLVLGSPIEGEKDLLYARVDGVQAVFALSEGIRKLSDYEVDALRERQLLLQDLRGLRQVRITGPDSAVLMARSENGTEWNVEEPSRNPVGLMQIGAVVNAWRNARIVEFIADPGPLKATPPLYTIEFSGGGGVNERFELRVRPGPAGTEDLVVHSLHDGAWGSVVPDLLRQISCRPLDYRDHRVLSLVSDDILSIQRRAGAAGETVARPSPDAPWASPERREVSSASVQALLNAASALNARRLVATNVSDLTRYGLQDPAVTLSFGLSGKAGLGRALLLGSAAGPGERFAMIRGQDLVFVLADDDAAPFLAPLLLDGTNPPRVVPHDSP